MNEYLFRPYYDKYRDQISTFREKGREWQEIQFACKNNEEGLKNFLESCSEDFEWPIICVEDWYDLVETMKSDEESRLSFNESRGAGIITDATLDNNLAVPSSRYSMWKLYEKSLKNKGFSNFSIQGIRDSAHRVLNRISLDTTVTGAIKGMVVGNVQSGKTANMAALMAMASDNGWNMFIILSGTIENLRKQTENRIYNDLKSDQCSLKWIPLQNLSKHSETGSRLSDLNFKPESKDRFFTVCLKNSTRLQNLLDWLYSDDNKLENMRILVIDDEADQASINSRSMNGKNDREIYEERTKINKSIVDLVEGLSSNGTKHNYAAMNYICYTATPYANFLNEASMESLYPGNFINFIDPAKEYFGPQEIFGIGYDNEDCCDDGLPIIRQIDDFTSRDLKNGSDFIPPKSLYQSFYYFLCAAAAMRYYQKTIGLDGKALVKKQPVSMLIHVSQKQKDHKTIHQALENMIKDSANNLAETLQNCQNIWEDETRLLTRKGLVNRLYEYYDSVEQINDYPCFEIIKNYIVELLSTKHTNILLNEKKDKQYHRGIHLCIDNCQHNMKSSDEIHMRLAYPEKIDIGEEAPAFIVIGGSTLSRGLTIEGLVTSYFTRTVKQADTLMQMGRWFGYRKGYELLQRIWMTEDTYDKFLFLSTLDFELRGELKRFRDGRVSPREYGPYIKNTPKASWISITAKNKMQGSKIAEMDFSGHQAQTIVFENDLDIMNGNIMLTEEFYRKLGTPTVSYDNSSLVWRNISFEGYIMDYLKNYHSAHSNKAFNDIEMFIDWISDFSKENNFKKWNVVAAGNGTINQTKGEYWEICGYKVGNSNRAKIHSDDDYLINIRVLRNPAHLISDVDLRELSEEEQKELRKGVSNSTNFRELRKVGKVSDVPLLLIYRVNKYYKYTGQNKKIRDDMNAKQDMIGLCVLMPGSNKSFIKKITIDIPKEINNEEEDYED